MEHEQGACSWVQASTQPGQKILNPMHGRAAVAFDLVRERARPQEKPEQYFLYCEDFSEDVSRSRAKASATAQS